MDDNTADTQTEEKKKEKKKEDEEAECCITVTDCFCEIFECILECILSGLCECSSED